MKNLKFRAWHIARKEYMEILLLHYNQSTGKVFALTLTNGRQDIPTFAGEFVLELYTGFYDDDGVEIYGGDLINVIGVKPWLDGLYCVEFDDELGAWVLTCDTFWLPIPKPETPYYLSTATKHADAIQVISNAAKGVKNE